MIFLIFSAFKHLVHTFELCTLPLQSPTKLKRILWTLGYTQRPTLLFALLTKFAVLGPFPHTKHILAIINLFALLKLSKDKEG